MLRYTTLLLLLLLLACASAGPRCDASDHEIHREQGHTFARRFRPLGGLFVSQHEFETRVQQITGLSAPCASCFGETYSCTWSHCKMACAFDGPSCETCRERAGCALALERCVGVRIE